MEWGYDDINKPDHWHHKYATISGAKQSPIDIQPEKYKVSTVVPKEKFKMSYHSKTLNLISNTGHSWQLTTDSVDSAKITGGPLSSCIYELVQIHAHWGNDDNEGSEHTINGHHFASELHFVHWNKTNYSNIQEAIQHPDGLCVLAVLVKKGHANHEMEKIVKKFPNILHKGDTCGFDEPVHPHKLLPKTFNYWSYMGSLTTPPCSECVIWIVFDEPIEISHEQLYRTLRCHKADGCEHATCEDHMRRNFRPTVPLGNRVIIRKTALHEISH